MKKPNAVHGPTWLEVDLSALGANVRALQNQVGRNTQLMAVVKADGYGAGICECAQTALENGATALSVSRISEAITLRRYGIHAPILNMGYCSPEEIELLPEYNIIQAIHCLDLAECLSKSAIGAGCCVNIHVNMDTGMCRSGVPFEEAGVFFQSLFSLKNINLTGVFTHFPTADCEDKSFAEEQISRFREIAKIVSATGFTNVVFHAANTAAVVDLPNSRFDMVRVGIGMYGLYGSRFVSRRVVLRPVCSLRSTVSNVHRVAAGTGVSYGLTYRAPAETIIATIQAGYADGVDRRLSNCGAMLIRGRKYPIVGRVTMDQTMLNLGPQSDVCIGDVATIIGRDGREELLMDEVAEEIGTIAYELQCHIGTRVPRVYIQ
ncbi:MAG: alanine racemase [Lentisphaerae bacterium]|nr:alanine racemase [Lentisphaerota bacterium]